jgi:hypothetical protein
LWKSDYILVNVISAVIHFTLRFFQKEMLRIRWSVREVLELYSWNGVQ